MTVLFTSVFSGIELIWDRQFGFLKETLVAPVPRLQIMIGRTLGGATVAVMQGLVVVVICLIAGFRPEHFATMPLALVLHDADGCRVYRAGHGHRLAAARISRDSS